MLKKVVVALIVVVVTASFAFAGAKTGDITVDSDVGRVTNVGIGHGVEAETNVHSVKVKDGAKTGDITVKGKAGTVTNVGVGHGVKAKTNVGSVEVGQ